MSRLFAISDIHGCSKTFIALIENVIKLKRSDELYLLGDYIDRGNDSKGVLDYILFLISQKFDVTVIRGNHEEMLLRSLSDPDYSQTWIQNGGDKTLASFYVTSPLSVPLEYLTFIKSMIFFKLLDQYALVHAGFDFQKDQPFEDKESMLWLRGFEVDPVKSGGRTVIHGHTPVSVERIKDNIKNIDKDKTINIDNGCVYKSNHSFGNLCALELKTLNVYFQPNLD
jgi:serine/threonine protein phosphatase 1